MTSAEPLFDYRRLAARRTRARRIAESGGNAGFLLEHVAGEMADRLRVVKREFRSAADILTPADTLATTLSGTVPGLDIERIEAGDEENLGLSPASLDLAASAFGLHWSNDLPGALAQINRALKPDGLFMAALPAEDTLHELRDSLIAAEAELSDGASLRVEPFIELRQAGGLLQRAGFALPVADIDNLVVRYDSVAALIADLRAMGATSALAGPVKPLPRGMLAKLEKIYAERFADADGRLRASFNIAYLTGWAPHESQQRPLKPGSAETSLAQFLKR